jgi:hypothetical protein
MAVVHEISHDRAVFRKALASTLCGVFFEKFEDRAFRGAAFGEFPHVSILAKVLSTGSIVVPPS